MTTRIQSVVFDGETRANGGLAATIARSGTAYQDDGAARGSNLARYASPKIIAGREAPTAIPGFSGSSCKFFGASSDPSEAGAIMASRKGQATLYIYTGKPEDYHGGDTSKGYAFDLNAGQPDLLYGQTGAGDGTAAIANHAFEVQGGRSRGGLMLFHLDHKFDDGGGYDSVGAALAYTTADRLADADPFTLIAVTERVTTSSSNHAQIWSGQLYEWSPTLWVYAWADYANDERCGGNVNLTFIANPTTAPAFTTVRMRTHYRAPGADDEHAHCAGILRLSNGDLCAVWSWGDGLDRNRLEYSVLPSADVAAGNFGNGVTFSAAAGDADDATAYGATGISGSYVIEQPHANWSVPAVAWGGVATVAGRAYRHNQLISMCQADADLSALLCGSDETRSMVLRMTWDEANDAPVFESVGVPAITSYNGDGVAPVTVSGHHSVGFVASVDGDSWDDAGTGGSGVADLEGAVYFSPDGEHWAHVFDQAHAGQFTAPIIYRNRIYSGCSSSGSPKSVEVPRWRVGQPLQVASAPANTLAATIAAASFAGASAGVTISDLASNGSDLPAGVPMPPCDPSSMVMVNVTGDLSAARNVIGNVTLASGLTGTFTDMHVRMWVYAVPFDGSTFNNRASAALWLDVQDTVSGGVFSFGRAIFGSGQWTPIGGLFLKSQMSASPGATWSPRTRLRADGLTTNTSPCQFVIAFEGLYLDGGTIRSSGTAPGAAATSEVATVSGFVPTDVWSLYVEAQMPFDQWDNRTGGGPPGGANEAGAGITATPSLFKLQGVASDTLEVRADPANNRVQLVSDAASANGASNKAWWRRGDPMLFVVGSDGVNTFLRYLDADGTLATVQIADAVTFSELVTVDPTMLHRVIYKAEADPDPAETLRGLADRSFWKMRTGGIRTRGRGRRAR